MKKTLLFLTVVLMGLSMIAQTTYTRISSASELEAGVNYIIVGYDEALGYCAMGYQKPGNRHAIQVSEDGGSITVVPGTDPQSTTEVFQFTLGGGEGAWTLFDEVKGGYLYAASSSANQLKTQTTLDANGQWNITFDGTGNAEVMAQGDNTRNIMRFNENSSNGTPLFSCYNSNSSINVPVSFYKAGGAVILPEPSNYPTSFMATANGANVKITWNDATGAQLPQKYLVLASTGNITVPQDGTPVANSNLAQNVSYGAQEVTFTGLNGGQTYRFAIFPYTNSGENIDYKNGSGYPVAYATPLIVTDLLFEDFDSDLGQFLQYSVSGEQIWHQATYNNVTYANMNGYADGAAHENEDWLISPEIWIGADIYYESISLEFSTAMKFDGEPLRVMLSNNYNDGDNPNGYDWLDITDGFDYSTGNYEWVESGAFDITEYALVNESFYVAFVYTSTDTAASSWEIDYVKVSGVEQLSVGENEAVSFNLYPNPANNNINIVAEKDAQVQIIDMTGRIVMSVNAVEGENSINVADLESGVYFVRMNNAVVKFVKR